MTVFKHQIDVSPEMLSFVGSGELPQPEWPAQPVVFCFDDGPAPTLTISASAAGADGVVVLVVAGCAIERLFGSLPSNGRWHVTSDLRTLVRSVEVGAAGEAGDTLRLAKSIELLCAVFDHAGRGLLVPADAEGGLSQADARRIAAARRLIEERWSEKLTLDAIARACGLNRGKLTRGFRALYACTVADALTERRLAGARRLLEATDLPIGTIGYRCGYLNNASFTRAFARSVGVAPTRWRAERTMAA